LFIYEEFNILSILELILLNFVLIEAILLLTVNKLDATAFSDLLISFIILLFTNFYSYVFSTLFSLVVNTYLLITYESSFILSVVSFHNFVSVPVVTFAAVTLFNSNCATLLVVEVNESETTFNEESNLD
jgi:hypothetical protein